MFDLSKLYLFLIATLALLLVPGPSVLYIVARSVNQGRPAGLASVLGVGTANLVHGAGAALGLSAILMSSALAFDVVKYLGAGYLIYLGIRKLLSRDEDQDQVMDTRENLLRIYSQGFLVNLLNPKTALFFLAFFPQFVNPANGNLPLQFLVLGALFAGMAMITDGTYALLSSSIASRLKGNKRFARGQRYFAGVVYVGLGVTTALAGSSKK